MLVSNLLGKSVVVSGPSGSGKSTLIRAMKAEHPQLVDFSVSYTTRSKREVEEHGRDYFFVSDDEFQAIVDSGGFLEHAGVYGRRYGTSLERTLEVLKAKRHLLLDIDVQGHRIMRAAQQQHGFSLFSVFVQPPSIDALERRLTERGDNDNLKQRLEAAQREIEIGGKEYDKVIINDDLALATAEFTACVLNYVVS